MIVVDRQQRSKVVLITLYFLCVISERSRGKVSVGMIGSMQLFARQMPKQIRTNPAIMLMYGKEASNRKQEIDRQHYTIPNQRPKDKHCGKI